MNPPPPNRSVGRRAEMDRRIHKWEGTQMESSFTIIKERQEKLINDIQEWIVGLPHKEGTNQSEWINLW